MYEISNKRWTESLLAQETAGKIVIDWLDEAPNNEKIRELARCIKTMVFDLNSLKTALDDTIVLGRHRREEYLREKQDLLKQLNEFLENSKLEELDETQKIQIKIPKAPGGTDL